MHTPTDDEREAITDEGLWDFASDLLDAWNIEDLNPPSLIEDFRDRFVRRFRRSVYLDTDRAWADWETWQIESMRAALRAAGGLHGQELVRIVENRGGRMVVIGVIRCPRCGTRLAEEVVPCTCADPLAAGAEAQPCPIHGWSTE
ncbi:hypothetical protein O5Y58_07415 [Microbacterium paraoxydans]|uniref:hypothetical protein n=1 Tax=Microbacterium paraoxydans TaxID=199592 RepID=UPI00352FB16E